MPNPTTTTTLATVEDPTGTVLCRLYRCETCRRHITMPHAPDFCPACGRKVQGVSPRPERKALSVRETLGLTTLGDVLRDQ